ncbi:hypothetical protein CEXT_69171 [Caerostris extrusa]|uniref:Uncharacterized protein n=1 Tax=Caerostris extrusa TaxID=172846 RepID=A0AAV4TUS9_CAEEX|nr:hypothetical protein CEXT_69171 [Caerostris extrusa]
MECCEKKCKIYDGVPIPSLSAEVGRGVWCNNFDIIPGVKEFMESDSTSVVFCIVPGCVGSIKVSCEDGVFICLN